MTPTDPKQDAYAATRAAWQRDVWAALAARLEEGMRLAEKAKQSGKE